MSERNHATARKWARFSEFVGLIFCGLGVVSGFLTLTGDMLGGALVLQMLSAGCFPTVVGGLLLIVVGRILRVVSEDSEE